MPLTNEEWRAFINEYNGAMDDVEADLRAALEGNRLALLRLVAGGTLPVPEADGLYQALREALLRAQDRLNALGRRIMHARGGRTLTRVVPLLDFASVDLAPPHNVLTE